jgi:hypothetical protein
VMRSKLPYHLVRLIPAMVMINAQLLASAFTIRNDCILLSC